MSARVLPARLARVQDVTLYMFRGSNACLTVQLLLDHAGVPYRTRLVPPGLHAGLVPLAGFRGRTVPAMRIGRERVLGSRAISHAVAERVPEAKLLPAGAAERRRVLEAEALGEGLQKLARRVMYVLAQRDPSLLRPLVDQTYSMLPGPARAAVVRALIPAASHGHAARADRIDEYVDEIATLLDRFDSLVEAGVVAGEHPNVADFQIAPNLALLALAHNLEPVLKARPAWRIAERVLSRYPLDVRAEVPASWVERLSAAR